MARLVILDSANGGSSTSAAYHVFDAAAPVARNVTPLRVVVRKSPSCELTNASRVAVSLRARGSLPIREVEVTVRVGFAHNEDGDGALRSAEAESNRSGEPAPNRSAEVHAQALALLPLGGSENGSTNSNETPGGEEQNANESKIPPLETKRNEIPADSFHVYLLDDEKYNETTVEVALTYAIPDMSKEQARSIYRKASWVGQALVVDTDEEGAKIHAKNMHKWGLSVRVRWNEKGIDKWSDDWGKSEDHSE